MWSGVVLWSGAVLRTRLMIFAWARSEIGAWARLVWRAIARREREGHRYNGDNGLSPAKV